MVLVSHPFGNANVRAALSGLHSAGLLSRFITTVASFDKNYFGRLATIPGLKSFARRKFDESLSEFTSLYPNREMIRLLSLQMNIEFLVEHSKGFFSTDKVIQNLDFKTANFILKNKNLKAIYAFEDGAIHSFKAASIKGLKKIYDLPIGYWQASRDILENEKKRWPEWACTIPAFKDPKEKLIRKDNELLNADVIYVAGSYTASTLKISGFQNLNIYKIPYGFPVVNDAPRNWYKGNDKLKLLYVGSLTQRKGIADIFNVVERFKDSISLTLVGKKTTNYCKPLNENLMNYQYFPSLPHHQILQLMHTHDVLIFPSLFEGFGLVVTEAMSQGMPVITTERTCGADLIKSGYNGWLIKAGNNDMLFNTLKDILDHPESVEKNGMNALNTAKQRPWHLYSSELADSVFNVIKHT